MTNYFKHTHALVETENIGADTRIWAFVHILNGAKIGSNCNVCDHCFIENDVEIGNNVTIKSGIYIWNGVKIENNAFLGPNVVFTNDLMPRSKQYPESFLKTLVEEGASIGANSVIIAGNTIGKFAMVGAGSVVTKDVPAYSVVFGNPAKFKYHICECTEKLHFSSEKAECSCGKEYIKSPTGEVAQL
ncbi:transferase [Lysinibacillus contaminans]|uniref:Transferase n=1 Tax=Lysinibacillus contaminans TaxID=1293441 RepID=A0ABR5JY79_9BACI|nr:acyltransferase [Lysinibacillus contaminans]KOS66609.1 transferase [Lysinibacillus contaminans]